MKKRKPFSKKLLYFDCAIAIALFIGMFACIALNGLYTMKIMNELIAIGIDASMISINPPFNIDIFGIVLGIWIAQLGLSAGAYYSLAKSEHKIELPMQLLNDLPQDIKEQVDMTTIITTVLSCTDN